MRKVPLLPIVLFGAAGLTVMGLLVTVVVARSESSSGPDPGGGAEPSSQPPSRPAAPDPSTQVAPMIDAGVPRPRGQPRHQHPSDPLYKPSPKRPKH
jgi:hypothetical protein